MELSQLISLEGQGAIVTGAAKGIGKAIAQRLAEAGALVLLVDTDAAAGERAVAEMRASARGRGEVHFLAADASTSTDALRAVADAMARFSRLDILVNNAGIFPMAPALDASEALWTKVIDVNLKGAFFFAQAAAREMAKTGRGGRIVNIASIDAIHPSGALAHYDASKGGMVMMTKSLAVEWARLGIRVNAISPGGISTPGAAAITAQATGGKVPPEAIQQAFLARIPVGRMGEPDDIARAVMFLATPMSDYVTGVNLVVDGGYLVA